MNDSSTAAPLASLEQHEEFAARHIGTSPDDQRAMLAVLGYASRAQMIDALVPESIRRRGPLALPDALTEDEALARIASIAAKNRALKSFIGQGYYGTHTPAVILRNVLENPAWYTAYTPYQPEISQGRLEALINYQTMIADLTGLAIANASMLDEATAAAEAMTLCQRVGKSRSQRFFVAADVFAQTIDVVRTRAAPLGIEVVVGPASDAPSAGAFAALLQYPGANGDVRDYTALSSAMHASGALVVAATDLLALTLLAPPGEWGADVAVGSSQRFGVPMGYGGPHAAFMATRDEFKRQLPGRLVGVTVDARGNPAYRLALQTREQHIRREKATSNICTAQVLLAVIASMYAVYHGPAGLATIARRVHRLAAIAKAGIGRLGFDVSTSAFFDTFVVDTGPRTEEIAARALASGANFRRVDARTLGLSFDETTTRGDVALVWSIFAGANVPFGVDEIDATAHDVIAPALARTSSFLAHPVFNRHHSETGMLRYLRLLSDRDIALDRSMIPLGSCTMKLNATAEMIPITWPAFANLHPFAPLDQARGYAEIAADLERMLCACTGYAAVSLQPNAGSQGEYSGLLAIRAYHASRGESGRNVCLIPSSAHGTNPASAQMAGMQVVVVACDRDGNVDLADLEAKAAQHRARLAAIMVTYPSTHGVFEAGVKRICEIVHANGGQVYVDGANLNALVGLAAPGEFGADVSHLNLHKTFCIPHGGGGPGVGSHCRRRTSRTVPARPSDAARAPGRHRRRVCRTVRQREHPADLVDVHRNDGCARPRRRDRERDPRGELRCEAARRALPGAVCGTGRARRPRVHPRPAAAEGCERGERRRRREAADGLWVPCADDELPGARNADGRADGERIDGRARPVRRRDDRDPRGNPRRRAGCRRSRRQSPEACTAHRRDDRIGRVAACVQPRARRVSASQPARREVLAAGRTRRQRVRRSQPLLQLHPGRRARRRRLTMRVLVLGGGVVGVAAAWYLACDGHDVALVDRRDGVGLETSFANGGQISASHAEPWANPHAPRKILQWLGREDAPLLFRLRADASQWRFALQFLVECLPARTRRNTLACLALALYSRDCLRALRRDTGIEYDALARGILTFYTDTHELEHALHAAALMRQHGCDLVAKSVDECIAIEPALAQCGARIAGGVYTASDESGDAYRFTVELARLASARGVELRLDTTIDAIDVAGGEVKGVRCRDAEHRSQTITADAYVVAMGSYSALVLRPIGVPALVYPTKGYSATIEVGAHRGAPSVSLTDADAKIVLSRLGERLRVAGTAELNGYDTSLNRVRCDALVRRTFELFPDAGERANARFWAGLRPATPSNVPLVGRTRYRNLFVDTGHGTLGWTMACGSARALADIVAGRQPEIEFPFATA